MSFPEVPCKGGHPDDGADPYVRGGGVQVAWENQQECAGGANNHTRLGIVAQ